MKNKNTVLLKALLKSTSQWNIYKYTKDKKKRGRVIGNTIGFGILHLMLIGYCIAMGVGYGVIGKIDIAPAICALVISLLAFVFTLFKTNGYLFGFKEYDMLMSLPFESKSVVSCKFLYMYFKSLPWYAEISLSLMVVYGIFKKPGIIVYPIWLLMSLLLPVIPMLVAAFIGFLIAKISSGFKKKSLIQTILLMIFVVFCFSLQFIIEAFFKDKDAKVVFENIGAEIQKLCQFYPPAEWFSNAIVHTGISDILLLTGCTLLLFEIVMIVVGKSYRKINSALKSHAATKKYEMKTLKKKSVIHAIVFKEYRRLVGSSVYMVNAGLGVILASLFGIIVLIFGFDNIVKILTKDAPFSIEIVFPAIPLIVYFLIGMVATTAISPSIEGKNYWIVQSLPIEKKVLYQGKMLFNLYLTVPAMLFAILCICISAHVPVFNMILYFIQGIILCAFSSAWGCVCGIKFMRLDWENEIEVVKQGAAVFLYMFPNMMVTMILVVLVIVLGNFMNSNIVVFVLTLIILTLTVLSYFKALAMAKKES